MHDNGFGNAGNWHDHNTWNREAAKLRALSAALGSKIDEEELILRDTREVISLRLRLRQAHRGHVEPTAHVI